MNSREELRRVRDRLLDLHKLLLDRERAVYEREHGRVGSPNAYLGLVLGHEQFEWLRQLSGMIVEVDELLAPRSQAGPSEADATLSKLREMMNLASDTDFSRRLSVAVEDAHEIAVAQKDFWM